MGLADPPAEACAEDCSKSAPPVTRAKSARRRGSPAAGPETAAGGRFRLAVEVAVASQTELLTYGVPTALEQLAIPGRRVTVPLRGKLAVGFVRASRSVDDISFDPNKLRPLVACGDELVPPDLLACLDFVARYYHAPAGAAARLALPAPMRHTGVEGDDAPERLQWLVQATGKRPWPHDLSKPEARILQRIEAAGSLTTAELRRGSLNDKEGAGGKAMVAPQTLLEGLADRGLVVLKQERILRDPLGMRRPVPADTPPVLHPEQRQALERLSVDLHARHYAGHLLRGVTGSGKTEIYLHLIVQALEQGRGAIVLVPEIALTPQLVERFRARLGDRVAALHSGLTEGERYDQTTQIALGQRRVVIGPRSALFAPVADLGVLVVDECHDGSFKQNTGLRYHARDVALVRAREARAVCVLGSATPGCEEMALVAAGRLTQSDLTHRAVATAMPDTRIVDLRGCERLPDPEGQRPSLVSVELAQAVADTVARGNQAILLHNRRGFATSMICQSCGQAVECPDCALSLTWHRGQGRLRCHVCDYSVPTDISCPTCHGRNLLGVGAGTERVEQTLHAFNPAWRLARFDRDTASGQRLLDTLDRFKRGEIDVLVGTQMLAKGHDFPAVTLVGVLLAETGLRVPDFRASERTFQLLTQVAGRAGRGDRPGRVLIQTYCPDHPAIQAALHHDHQGFCDAELGWRERTGYPPYQFLALLEARHSDPDRPHLALQIACDALRQWGAEVRGPVQAGLAKVRGVHRVHALIRSADRRALHHWLDRLEREIRPLLPSGVELLVDVDPHALA
jgi:primosomal protein N' (replication factor Y)